MLELEVTYFYIIHLNFFFFLIGIFNLGGLPFLLNFFTKHLLFNEIYLNNLNILCVYIILYLAAFCGFFYSIKIFFYSFFHIKKNHYSIYNIYFQTNFINLISQLIFIRSNKLAMISIILLYIISLCTLIILLQLFINNLNILLDIYNYTYIFKLQFSNIILFKLFLFFVIFLLIIIYFNFKTNNKFYFNYIFIYIIFIFLI